MTQAHLKLAAKLSEKGIHLSPAVNAGALWPRGNDVIRPSFLKVRIQLPMVVVV